MQDIQQILIKSLFIFMIALLVAVSARPQLTESNQLVPDQDSGMLDSGLKPWQMELLAQRLIQMNQLGNADYGFERDLRSATERKRRYRTCYFNPVSCFK